jgi:hypothetical protein
MYYIVKDNMVTRIDNMKNHEIHFLIYGDFLHNFKLYKGNTLICEYNCDNITKVLNLSDFTQKCIDILQ